MSDPILDLPMQEVSLDVMLEKYAKADENSISEIRARVAKALAQVEFNLTEWQKKFQFALENGFIPGGRINSAAGTGINATLINCFVQPIDDCISSSSEGEVGIFNAVQEAAETQRRGGGVGYDFSPLRPKDAFVKGTHSRSSGPVSYMRVFDRMCETVESAGSRRGAQMAVLRCDHPDVFYFINAKKEGDLKNFNISVGVTDLFMQLKEQGCDIELWHEKEPCQQYIEENNSYQREDGKWVYRKVPALEIWHNIMKNTYEGAEPGVLYIDRINALNNLSYCEDIRATNPCGEQPLPPYGCCCLGSVALTYFVRKPFTSEAYFDWDLVRQVAKISTRALDNVLDITVWPLEQQRIEAQNKRRIGLGFTGLGSTLVMLGIKYNSADGLKFADEVAKCLTISAYESSVETAYEKGSFPLFDAEKYLKAPHFASTLPIDLKRDIKKRGIRNSHCVSIAPTGTISLAFADNSSNGIEPAFSWTYQRKKRMPDETHRIYDVEDHAYRVYKALGNDVNNLPEQFVSALEMSAQDHLNMVIAVAPWIDSAISKTVNVPEDYPFDEFQDLYTNAWKAGLKGLTTFRPNSITGSILSIETKQEQPTQLIEVEPRVKFNYVPTPVLGSLKWKKRPTLNEGNPSWTYLSSGPGFSFSTVIGHIDGDMSPFEVWVNGAEAPRGLGALAKTLSMDMRSKDRGFLKLNLEAISQTQGYTSFTYDMPNCVSMDFTNPVALFASLVTHRCDKLGAFEDLSYSPLLDSMLSQKESLTTSGGAMGWYVDIRNPVTSDHFVMMLKEGELPDGRRIPYGVSLSEAFPPSLLGLCKSLSLDMTVLDPAWIGAKLRQLSDFLEPQGNFFAKIPGSDKQIDYPSTVAYMVALIMHRYVMLGILDEKGYPVNSLGMLSVEDAAEVKTNTTQEVAGTKCPDCSHKSVIKLGGCQTCTNPECGYIGSCG